MKYALAQWRRNSNNLLLAKNKLARFMVERLLYRCRQAFQKWQNTVMFDDYTMRVQSSCTRAAHLQFKTSVFQAWRQQTTRFRTERLSQLNKTWSRFEKARLLNRNQFIKVQLVLQSDKVSKHYLLRVCFQQMRVVLKTEREQSCRDMLCNEVVPDIERLRAEVR